MDRFEYFYKQEIKKSELESCARYDVFISAYNSTDRVNDLFSHITANEKYWLIFPEYNYKDEELPATGDKYSKNTNEESLFINEFIDKLDLTNKNICIDITGFIRPHLLFLLKKLHLINLIKFDLIYTEPSRYIKKDETEFASNNIRTVRSVHGFEGGHLVETDDDLLIIGVGYDHELIASVVDNKNYISKVVPLWGFPSLRADMYQENVLRVDKSGDFVMDHHWKRFSKFAMANDPFATADTLKQTIMEHKEINQNINVYLSPLSTKAQVAGFALYYIYENLNSKISIIFPFSDRYSRETSVGISRIWKYTIEYI